MLRCAAPPTVSVPERCPPVFEATANCTEPFPLPVAPCVTVMKFALLAAVQVHPLPAATVIDALPPSGPNVVVVCPRENVQDVGGEVGLPAQALAARSASRGSTQ